MKTQKTRKKIRMNRKQYWISMLVIFLAAIISCLVLALIKFSDSEISGSEFSSSELIMLKAVRYFGVFMSWFFIIHLLFFYQARVRDAGWSTSWGIPHFGLYLLPFILIGLDRLNIHPYVGNSLAVIIGLFFVVSLVPLFLPTKSDGNQHFPIEEEKISESSPKKEEDVKPSNKYDFENL